jgi:hyperosmotically inducible protein
VKQLYRNRILTLAACAALAFGLGACSSTQTASTQVDDATITASVKSKLVADPAINPFNIDVDTNEGTVRLSGTVEKAEARAEAVRLARNTAGVVRVINDIEVGRTTVGKRIDDTALTTKVATKIAADTDLNSFNIDVDSNEGVVTLSGRVATQAAKDEAGQIARDTEGVVSVENRLEVGQEMATDSNK